MRRIALVILLELIALPALAVDRHVYLATGTDKVCITNHSTTCTTSADCPSSTPCVPILHDCPNPAHNAKGTSNTDALQYCSGGSNNNKVIGTASGRVASATCTGSGGALRYVTNGSTVDVDGDGTNEFIYGHPQACVYYMAKSDSCEVHAGDYRTPGAQCTESCGSEGADETTGTKSDSCDRHDCWLGEVFASGYFADGHTDGYGTLASPGFLRSAVMTGSTDSWDANGNLKPEANEALTPYSARFNLDYNIGGGITCDGTNNATCHEVTTCKTCPVGETCGGGGFCSVTTSRACDTTATCRGDGFVGLRVGCGSGNNGNISCPPTPKPLATRIQIDTDADGVFDTYVGASGPRNTDWLSFVGIEVAYPNGGPAAVNASKGHRAAGGTINWGADGNSDGPRIDHIWLHDGGTSPSAIAGFETWWAGIEDGENSGCSDYMEIKNSRFKSGNIWLLNDDCGVGGGGSPCGCPKWFHNNLVEIAPTSTAHQNGFAYLKSIDSIGDVGSTRPKQQRIAFNVIEFNGTTSTTWLWDLEGFGNSMTGNAPYEKKCSGAGCGELWFYGNIVYMAGSGSSISRVNGASCGIGTGEWRHYNFNNTYDLERSDGAYRDFDLLCDYDHGPPPVSTTIGKSIVEKNNLYYKSSNLLTTEANSKLRVNDLCSETSGVVVGTGCTTDLTGRAGWFNSNVVNTPIDNALVNYRIKAAGPADNVSTNNPCDPDGDGQPGYKDWDGVTNITSWTDIAGNIVNCPTIGTSIDLGAEQTIDCTGDICGNGKLCATGSGPGVHPEACDDGNTSVETSCPYGTPTCTGCAANCGATITGLTGHFCGDTNLDTGNGEDCEASLGIGGATCAANFPPCLTGTPACVGCHITIGTCSNCAGTPGATVTGGIVK